MRYVTGKDLFERKGGGGQENYVNVYHYLLSALQPNENTVLRNCKIHYLKGKRLYSLGIDDDRRHYEDVVQVARCVATGAHKEGTMEALTDLTTLEAQALESGIVSLATVIQAVKNMRASAHTRTFAQGTELLLTQTLWWLNAMRDSLPVLCDRCLKAQGTRHVREICQECDDVLLCLRCFSRHEEEVAADRSKDRKCKNAASTEAGNTF